MLFRSRNMCNSILNNENVNLIQFDMILSKMIYKHINPFEHVYKSFNDKCNGIYNDILLNIESNKFTNASFIEFYTKYINKCIFMKKLFYKLNKYCKSSDSSKSKSKYNNIIYIISNYWFYKNIFEKSYDNNNIQQYIN